LVYVEELASRAEAMKRELAIKAMGRERKMILVSNSGQAGK
jgi:predicted GIY-YIG superfamily endonuclease